MKRAFGKELKPFTEAMNERIRQMWDLAAEHTPLDFETRSLLAHFELDLVYICLNKRSQGVCASESADHACFKFIDAVQEAKGVHLSDAWDSFKPEAAAAAGSVDPPADIKRLVMVPDHRSNQFYFQRIRRFFLGMTFFFKGFEPSMPWAKWTTPSLRQRPVSRWASSSSGRETRSSPGSRPSKAPASGSGWMTALYLAVESLLSSSWKVVQPKAEPETLGVEELQQMLPCKSSEMQVQTLRGKVMQAVRDLEEKHSKVYDALSVQMKPSKAVFSTDGFAKHKLVLVPCSWKIEGRRPGDDVKPQKNSVCLGKLSWVSSSTRSTSTLALLALTRMESSTNPS